jgi:hypothetical protein
MYSHIATLILVFRDSHFFCIRRELCLALLIVLCQLDTVRIEYTTAKDSLVATQGEKTRLFSRLDGWIVPGGRRSEGPSITQGARNIGSQQTAFDAELAAIEQAISRFQESEQQHMTDLCLVGLGLEWLAGKEL